jgi:hypothetical protein
VVSGNDCRPVGVDQQICERCPGLAEFLGQGCGCQITRNQHMIGNEAGNPIDNTLQAL